jgi:hypothetical protein
MPAFGFIIVQKKAAGLGTQYRPGFAMEDGKQ